MTSAITVSALFDKKYALLALLIASIGLSLYGLEAKKAQYYKELATENGYNIIEQALKDQSSTLSIIATIERWKTDGWTAQTGSLKTVCTLAPKRLNHIMPIDAVQKSCILVR